MVKKLSGPCYVLGVGMTKFVKPRGKIGYEELVSLMKNLFYDCMHT